jgi:hypothetical protein
MAASMAASIENTEAAFGTAFAVPFALPLPFFRFFPEDEEAMELFLLLRPCILAMFRYSSFEMNGIETISPNRRENDTAAGKSSGKIENRIRNHDFTSLNVCCLRLLGLVLLGLVPARE